MEEVADETAFLLKVVANIADLNQDQLCKRSNEEHDPVARLGRWPGEQSLFNAR